MMEQYEAAIRDTFKYLNDYISDPDTGPLKIDEAIESHMRIKGFEVYCTYAGNYDIVYVFPKADNLPIHRWSKEYVY